MTTYTMPTENDGKEVSMNNYIEFLKRNNPDMLESYEYANFIMNASERPICNGDMLTELMEEGYLFEEYVIWKNEN